MGNINKVISSFKELGIKPNLDDFQSKLVMQKTVYLLSLMGVKLDFHYGLYVRGCYSPELTEVLYSNRNEVVSLLSSEKLSTEEKIAISEFKKIMGDLKPSFLEIAATYVFLIKDRGLSSIDATKELKLRKPFYTEAEFAVGISRAKQLFYRDSEIIN